MRVVADQQLHGEVQTGPVTAGTVILGVMYEIRLLATSPTSSHTLEPGLYKPQPLLSERKTTSNSVGAEQRSRSTVYRLVGSKCCGSSLHGAQRVKRLTREARIGHLQLMVEPPCVGDPDVHTTDLVRAHAYRNATVPPSSPKTYCTPPNRDNVGLHHDGAVPGGTGCGRPLGARSLSRISGVTG